MKKIVKLICATGILAMVLQFVSCAPGVSGVKNIPDNDRDSDTSEKKSNAITYVTASNVEDGIQFHGSKWLQSSYTSNTVIIKDETNDIAMCWDNPNAYNEWTLVYPLVQKGKEYEFTVILRNGYAFKLYEEHFKIKAEGGLGEYKIENADKYKIILTDDKVLKKEVKAVYTNNPNIKIQREGIYYDIYAGQTLWQQGNYSLAQTENWFDVTDGTFGITKPFRWFWSSYNGSKIDETILNGNNLLVWSGTRLKIAGFTYDGNVFFEMNDFQDASFPWGGEKAKCLISYGVDIRNSNYYIINKSDFEEFLENFELTNMPGEKVAKSFTWIYTNDPEDEEDDETETQEFLYTQVVDNVCSVLNEPRTVPTLISKDGKNKFRFTGWNCSFPTTPSSEKGLLNNKDAFITRIYANFEIIE